MMASMEHKMSTLEHKASGSFQLTSTAIVNGKDIPARYTCDGENISPPLQWGDVPDGTRSLALVVHDPDAPDPAAPKMNFCHWILYNIPPGTRSLPEGMRTLPEHSAQGKNDWGKTGWRGPEPPIGQHRYFFELHALNKTLPSDLGAPTHFELEGVIKGHIISTATLMGTYQKSAAGQAKH
jgi:Raf kinase inhibitor-like YbhB/YbcL family protein